MDGNNVVVETSKAADLINNCLNNSISNPYLICTFKSEGEIKEEKFVLDNGAVQIIKAYYKSKNII